MDKTELEQLAKKITTAGDILDALEKAYQLGRASARTPAQVAAWERNRRRGRKPGVKDKKPRVRRTKAEMGAEKVGLVLKRRGGEYLWHNVLGKQDSRVYPDKRQAIKAYMEDKIEWG